MGCKTCLVEHIIKCFHKLFKSEIRSDLDILEAQMEFIALDNLKSLCLSFRVRKKRSITS
jgi:hypothetical protein